MFKKLFPVLLYLSLLSIAAILIAYLIGLTEIIQAIHFSLLAFGISCFFLAFVISKNRSKPILFSSMGLLIAGSLLWLASLLKFFEFSKTWNLSFLLMMSGICIAIYGKVFRKCKPMVRILFSISTCFLLVTIFLTGSSYFDHAGWLLCSLSIYTGIGLMVLIFPKKRSNQS